MDEYGNQIGGVRITTSMFPIATYLEDGTIIPFNAEKLRSYTAARITGFKKVSERLDKWLRSAGFC